MLQRLFVPCFVLGLIFFVLSPVMIARAPYESTMGLVQKIFYYHVPTAVVMFLATFVCGIASAIYLFAGRPRADRIAAAAGELTALFGLMVLVSGPLWGRKAWGVWWQWDARLTLTLVLWLIFVSYLLLRRYGGPGSDKLAAGLALFGMANVPFVYWSVNIWRTVHPKTTVVPTLGPGMFGAFWWCLAAFVFIFIALLAVRVRLEDGRAALERAYLEVTD